MTDPLRDNCHMTRIPVELLSVSTSPNYLTLFVIHMYNQSAEELIRGEELVIPPCQPTKTCAIL